MQFKRNWWEAKNEWENFEKWSNQSEAKLLAYDDLIEKLKDESKTTKDKGESSYCKIA